jgi:hypothetical protein
MAAPIKTESRPIIAEAPAVHIEPIMTPTLEYGVFAHQPTPSLTNFANKNDDSDDLDLTIELDDTPARSARRARRRPRHEVTRV